MSMDEYEVTFYGDDLTETVRVYAYDYDDAERWAYNLLADTIGGFDYEEVEIFKIET